jgi:hypothetical protein
MNDLPLLNSDSSPLKIRSMLFYTNNKTTQTESSTTTD